MHPEGYGHEPHVPSPFEGISDFSEDAVLARLLFAVEDAADALPPDSGWSPFAFRVSRSLRTYLDLELRPISVNEPPNRVAWLRRASRLSHADIAERLGVDEAEVRAWERGKAPIADRYALELADMFGVSTVWMLGLEGES